MKKLVYLIVVIVALGLIVPGCIPVVPPAEQNESELLPNKSPGLNEDEYVNIELGETSHGQSIGKTLGLKSNFYIREIHEWVYNNTFESPMSDFYLDKELKEGVDWSESSWYSRMTIDRTYCQAFGDPVYPAGLTGDVEARFHWTSHFNGPSGDFSFDIVFVGESGLYPEPHPYAFVFNVAYNYATGDWSVTTRPYEGSGLEPLPPLSSIGVGIDIKPGSDPNSINLKAKGLIPVAILTTPGFDATATVDWTTVKFGPNAAMPVHDLSDLLVLVDHQQDVDEDGDVDFVFHFRTQETGITTGQTSAMLTGETYDGITIVGTDTVRIVGK